MSTFFVDDVSVVVTDDGTGTVGLADLAAETAARIAADAAETLARIAGDALAIPLVQKGAPSGVATLDGSGKVPASELPPFTVGQTFTANSEAEMLAAPASVGDICIRADMNPDGFFLLLALPASVLGNWSQILSPDTVLSVDGRTGTVSLTDLYDAFGAYNRAPARFGKAGTVAVTVGKAPEPISVPSTMTSVTAVVHTAPVGDDMILQVVKNATDVVAGTVVATLTILDGTNGVTVNTAVPLVPGDLLTLDVLQVGSDIAGWDLTVKVLFA